MGIPKSQAWPPGRRGLYHARNPERTPKIGPDFNQLNALAEIEPNAAAAIAQAYARDPVFPGLESTMGAPKV